MDDLAASPSLLREASITDNLQVKTAKDNKVQFTIWHGARKHVACLRTIKSLVENMIIGVTKVSTHHSTVSEGARETTAWHWHRLSPEGKLENVCCAIAMLDVDPASLVYADPLSSTALTHLAGIPLQDAIGLRPFPHQRHPIRGRNQSPNPKLLYVQSSTEFYPYQS